VECGTVGGISHHPLSLDDTGWQCVLSPDKGEVRGSSPRGPTTQTYQWFRKIFILPEAAPRGGAHRRIHSEVGIVGGNDHLGPHD